MDDSSNHDPKRRWFIWGAALAWIVSIPAIVGVLNSFRGISEQKATGLGAVAGGLAEGYVTFGVILEFVLPVAAIALLVKSFSAGHRTRAFVSVLHICLSALILAFASLSAWMFFIYLPRTTR